LAKQLISAIEQMYNEFHGDGGNTEHEFSENNRFYVHFCDGEVAVSVLVEKLIRDEEGVLGIYGCVPNFSSNDKDTWYLTTFDLGDLILVLEELKTDIRAKKIDFICEFIKNKGDISLSNPVTTNSGIKIDKPFVCHSNGETSVVETGNDVGVNVHAFSDEVIDSIYRESKSKEIDISLTEKQKAVLEKFYDALKELDDAGIGVIHEMDSNSFQFYDARNVAKISNTCDASGDLSQYPGWINVQEQLNKCPSRQMGYYYYANDSEQIIVMPKR
jgi:hypothetical protein